MCDINVLENVIRENQWGGVDIRRGGDPILRNNYICYGYSDGVVVGERGRGLIEGNHVYCMYFYLILAALNTEKHVFVPLSPCS